MGAHVLTEADLEPFRRQLAELQAKVERLAGAGPAADDLTTTAAAARARVSRETILDWIKTKGLPAHRPPGARAHLIRRADLEAFLANPSARRPPPSRGPVDLPAEARRILHRRKG